MIGCPNPAHNHDCRFFKIKNQLSTVKIHIFAGFPAVIPIGLWVETGVFLEGVREVFLRFVSKSHNAVSVCVFKYIQSDLSHTISVPIFSAFHVFLNLEKHLHVAIQILR